MKTKKKHLTHTHTHTYWQRNLCALFSAAFAVSLSLSHSPSLFFSCFFFCFYSCFVVLVVVFAAYAVNFLALNLDVRLLIAPSRPPLSLSCPTTTTTCMHALASLLLRCFFSSFLFFCYYFGF